MPTGMQNSPEPIKAFAVFDVTFAYRVMQTGAVGKQALNDWIEDKAINAIGKINPAMSLTSTLPSLSRLNGARGGVSTALNNVSGLVTTGVSRIL